MKKRYQTPQSLWFILLLAVAASCSTEPEKQRPNILFVLADDQTWLHSSSYGSKFVSTPNFDRLANEGILFNNAFVSAPSCNPSRASVLTGKPFYTLQGASMNHSVWPKGLTTYVELLAASGYHTGYTGKGTSPTDWKSAGLERNPSGKEFNSILYPKGVSKGMKGVDINYAANFNVFLEERKGGQPFCFWAGLNEPHRPYQEGLGLREGKKLEDVELPGFYPDVDTIRSDFLDYAAHIEWGDMHLGLMLEKLEEIGELDNTLVIFTADNGMPFPRCKAGCYEWGIHMPLAIMWGNEAKGGRVVDDFVSFTDFAPTFLEAAGLPVPQEMTGKSLLPIISAEQSGTLDPTRNYIIAGVERHFPGCREQGLGYPIRAIRTEQYLYIHNYAPERWPACPPKSPVWPADDPTGAFGAADGSITKTFLINNQEKYPEAFRLAFGKRPRQELYDVTNDPFQLENLATDPNYRHVLDSLHQKLTQELEATQDPRATGRGEILDKFAMEGQEY